MVESSINNSSGSSYQMKQIHSYVLHIITVLVVLMLASPIAKAAEQQQTTFSKAEDAVQALLTALQTDGKDGLLEIFGSQYEAELMGGDEANSRENLEIVARAMLTHTDLINDGKNRKTLIIGSENWPVPFPLVREKRRWRFDTEAGIEEVVNRRVGRNELDAISNCHAYVDAQIKYASADRDGDEVLEYAQAITSTHGNKDGLYWETAQGEEESPFGPFMADAKGYLRSEPGDPFKGYYYKVISRQGADAAGGRYDYIINGNMIAGFGLIAFPADHGNSGVMTFMCNHQGKVYEKDFGPDSDLVAASVEEYNPKESWNLVKQ
ncbi:MAG: DUF2950 domain-containing protein [Pseudomonadales bacterium]|nr:DUF2950 domain-containing protein [Pseudomonadales bacterium]